MPESTLAVMPQSTGHIVISNEWEKNLELVKRTVAIGLSDEEFALFCHIAHVRHLDPLQRQIHAVVRRTWDSQNKQWVQKMTIQTGIDGYRSIANRTNLYMPSDKSALIEDLGKANMRITMWVKRYYPTDNTWHEFGATAWYSEFVQTRTFNEKQEPNAMWQKMPVNQLTKCAEALALRKGWPEELGGIYVDEEMQHLDVPLPPETGPKQDKTQRDVGKMKPSSEPNRGHGNEGTQRAQQEKTICAECRETNGHKEDCKNNPKNKPKEQPKEATTTKKISGRERWEKYEGRTSDCISFDEGLQLFEIQKDLNLSEDDVKAFLKDKFKIEHRPLILKAQFQEVLDAIHKQFDPKGDEPSSGSGPLDNLFDRD